MGYRRVGLVNTRLGVCHTMPQRGYVSVVFGDKGVDDVIGGDFALESATTRRRRPCAAIYGRIFENVGKMESALKQQN